MLATSSAASDIALDCTQVATSASATTDYNLIEIAPFVLMVVGMFWAYFTYTHKLG